MGIFAPDSGEILFQTGHQINKKKIGYLPEERGIYDNTPVLDTILYFANLKGMEMSLARTKAENWLKKLGLENFAQNKIEDLSKGMQQKVQFIISILHNPKLIVLDEVFSGLDPVNQDLFKEVIKELAAGGTTILLSSHRMSMVEELCDRIFMINQGRQVLYGDLEKIKDEFGVRKVRLLTDKPAYFRNKNKFYESEIDGLKVSFNLPVEISPAEFIKSLPADLNIEEVSILRPPLHEIFVAEVKGGTEDAG